MNEKNPSQSKLIAFLLVAFALGLFVAIFTVFHDKFGFAVAALTVIPITLASWYLGTRGGIITAIASILSYNILLGFSGKSLIEILSMPSTVIGSFALLFTGYGFGRFAAVTKERREAYTKLAHSNEFIYSLIQVSTHIEKALTPDEILRVLGEELRKIGLLSVIASCNTEKNSFNLRYISLDQNQIDQLNKDIGFPLGQYTFPINKLIPDALDIVPSLHTVACDPHHELGTIFTQEEVRIIAEFLKDIDVILDIKVYRLLLMFEENLLGILWIWGKGITEIDLPALSIFAKQIGLSLERARLFQEVQDLALTDPLTSLNNRRSLFELGRIEFSRAERLDRPFSCLMLDLDHFKEVNDTYGHQTGDKVLQEFAKRCRDCVREIDLIGRYGGEELIILMPETEIERATQVAERLRISICEQQMRVANLNLDISVSIGVATKDENTLELETIIARADQAMYIAKHKGRNRVAVSK